MDYRISHLRNVYYCKERQAKVLHQGQVTAFSNPQTFEEVCQDILNTRYPTLQSSKTETYGFTPCLFTPDDNGDIRRTAEASEDHLTLLVLDMDNKRDDRPYYSFQDLVDFLATLGLNNLCHTSFSHTDEKHKARAVIDIDREITHEEAFKLFCVFNHEMRGQLDAAINDKGDYVYAIPHQTLISYRHDLSPLAVDDYLTIYDDLPEDSKIAYEPKPEQTFEYKPSPFSITGKLRLGEISIFNPRVCSPKQLEKLKANYKNSRHQSSYGTLCHIKLKCGQYLSPNDYWTLLNEIDQNIWFGFIKDHKEAINIEMKKLIR